MGGGLKAFTAAVALLAAMAVVSALPSRAEAAGRAAAASGPMVLAGAGRSSADSAAGAPHVLPRPRPEPKPLGPFSVSSETDLETVETPRTLNILQIGDSHTAADFFTGALRRRLQARYGAGGAGYLPPGRPHPGVLSDQVSITASEGWTYQGIRTADDTEQFFLSGFTATTDKAGETITYEVKGGKSLPFSIIDVEALFGPGRGSIEVVIDNLEPIRQSLARSSQERLVLRIEPTSIGPKTLHTVTIRTLDDKPVTLGGIGILRPEKGVTFTNFGYPGATADALRRFSPKAVADDLKRINPQVVILSFGTNDGFDDDLSVSAWADRYRDTVRQMQAVLPAAKVILVGPPDGNRLPRDCADKAAQAICVPPGKEPANACVWQTPPNLNPVRDAIRRIAEETGTTFWNWASISPKACGASLLVHAHPPLMAGDHVHFTREGYRRSADLFAKTVISVIDRLKAQNRAVSNH